VPDDDRVLLAERLDEPDDVPDRVQERVRVDFERSVREAEPAQVGRDDAKPRSGDRTDLMAP
jgi:hypothetical protein